MWTGAQVSFDMVRVFIGVIKDVTDRTKQCSINDESSAHLVELVEVASIMFTGDTVLKCCKIDVLVGECGGGGWSCEHAVVFAQG